MRKRMIALSALAAIALAGGAFYASLDKETRGLLAVLPTNADVLSWRQDQRDAAFRALDRLPFLARARAILPSPPPSPLPPGEPLTIPDIDAYMANQREAGLVIVQDGKVRFERYGLGFDAAGRWTSFSVAKSFTSTCNRNGLMRGCCAPTFSTTPPYNPMVESKDPPASMT